MGHVGIPLQRIFLSQGILWQVFQTANVPAAVFFIKLPGHITLARKGFFQFSLRAARVPDRNLMSPPELTANAPVALLAEPVLVGLAVAFGEEFHVAARDRIHCRL